MMPNRILREGILTSERVDALPSWASEVFYRRLHSVVDDFGRYYANSSLLRAACYPLKIDKVSNADIDKWLADCAGAGLVSTYDSGGKRYLQLLNFRQQVRAKDSKFPQMSINCIAPATHPPDTCGASAHLDGDVVVDEDGGEKTRARRARPFPMPDGFSISERVRKWAASKGYGMLELHFEAFVSTCKAKGYVYVDWDEALMTAIRKDWAELRKDLKANGKALPGAPWYLSWPKIEEEGKRRGIFPREDEPAPIFRDKVFAAAGVTGDMLRAAVAEFAPGRNA